MKRLALLVGIFLCASNPIETYDPPIILDTTPITANPVILLQEEVRETKNWEQNCYDDTIQVSYEDAQRLLKIAWAEAGNQGIDGQLHIMEVVWNRVNSPDYPNTIEEVIKQPGQFESYSNGGYGRAQPTAETHHALAEFEKNRNLDTDIVAFETTRNGRTLEKYYSFLYTSGQHDFYVKKSP